MLKHLIHFAFPQTCTTTDCLCTTPMAVSIQDCINCIIEDDPSISEVSTAQSIIDSAYLILPSIFLLIIYAFSFLAFENLCSTVTTIPSVTINTDPATLSQSTPSPTIPLTTSVIGSQIIVGPSSTTSSFIVQGASSVGITSTASIVGSPLPLKGSASPNEIKNFHWTGALLALAVGSLLVF